MRGNNSFFQVLKSIIWKRNFLVGSGLVLTLGSASTYAWSSHQRSTIPTPTLNTVDVKNDHIYLNWDVDIPSSSVFWNDDFESKELDLTQNKINGFHILFNGAGIDHWGNNRPTNDAVRSGLKIINGVGIDGTKGVVVNQTIPNNGWNYTYYGNESLPLPGVDNSGIRYVNWEQLITDRPAIARFKGKGDGNFAVDLSSQWTGNGVYNQYNLTWAETLSASEFESALINKKPIKVNNTYGQPIYNLHLTTAFDYSYSYNFKLAIAHITESNGEWYLHPVAWHGPWSDAVKPGQYVTPVDQRAVESIYPGKHLSQLQGTPAAANNLWVNSSDWKDYSMNMHIPYSKEINDLGNYFNVNATFKSESQLFIDNFTIAYAPKSRVYRNGELILDDYTVEYKDTSATDISAPNKANISADYIDGKLHLSWEKGVDQGTSYSYTVSSLNENNQESSKSSSKTVTITSGVKEYRIYLNNTLIKTTTDLSYQFNKTVSSSDKIEIGVVDNAGNETKTVVEFLNLTTEAKPSENMIRLDWTAIKDSLYQVYQKKEGSKQFESIGRPLETVNVLNIYPTNWEYSTFTTWDGETLTLPVGGMLKKWMEEPNAEHPKGYGQGLIEVTPVDYASFNQNPEAYLKQNPDGTWNYDVVMVGSYDCNGDCNSTTNSYFSTAANTVVSDFIDNGYGVLIGHDFRSLANKVETEGIPAVEPVGSSLVKISKKGILTNFPWNLGDIGTILQIPYTHNAGPYVEDSNIWMKFEGNNDPNHCYYGHYNWCRPDKFWFSSTNNHYLAIKNNVAMIQTGHSGGSSTPDEQKIIANTLFFLKQISDQNHLNDYSGQDVKAPNKPVSKSTKALSDGYVEITFDTLTDQGSTYEYYVKATHKNGNSSVVSNIETETITSGIAGVSYVIDTNLDTKPDNQLDNFSNNKIKVKPNSSQTTFLHIKIIDNAGNSSETEHIMISVPKINTAEQHNKAIHLNWDIGIPQNSILFQTDFESTRLDYSQEPALEVNAKTSSAGKYVDPYGSIWPLTHPIRNSIKILPNLGLNQTSGIRVNKTTDKLGWDYHWYSNLPSPNGEANTSSVEYGEWIRLTGDRPLIGRFDVKGTGTIETKIDPGWWTGGSIEDPRFTWAEALSSSEFWHRLNQNIPIKINNSTGESEQNYHLATALDRSFSYNYLLAQGDIYQENGQWYYKCTAYAYAWKDWVRPEQSVTPDGQRTVSSISVGQPLYVLESQEGSSNKLKINSTDWTTYSFNLTVPNTEILNALNYYFFVSQTFETADYLQLDNLTVAYAPKSRLYRDGKLILDDYTVEHIDQTVKDTTAPEKVSVSTQYINGKLQLTWQKTKDKGTIYTYEVSNIDENGQESLRSEPKDVEFISGIKEYRIYLNGTLIDTTTNPNYQFQDELTPSDRIEVGVVDEAGNESKTEVEFLHLTAEAKPTQNMIRLDWNALNEHTYQVYQKKEGSNEFQSISTSDLSKTKQIQVLNIYPDSCLVNSLDCPNDLRIPSDSSFTTWDGETFTLPQSAKLKRWMEEPNNEHPKGYGQGLIEVTPVSFTNFNINPESYLKNSDGSWKYDVIMIGTWDSNGQNADITKLGRDLLVEFLDSNRGVLFGHDTIRGLDYGTNLSPYLNSLKDYIKLTLNDIDFSQTRWHRSTTVEISKKGLLTNYPWRIGDIGDTLTIPESHTVDQLPGGDIWIKFRGKTSYDEYNYYLTTWNNTAMIQTGHSNGSATPDEQKILANTLFYLNQLSSNNWLDDYSGQDVKAPEKPSVFNANVLSTGEVEVIFNDSIDYGSIYEYYVKAIHKSGSEQVSNTVSEMIMTGVKGVSYVIDTNPTTEPDSHIEPLTNQTILVKPNQTKTTYLHIKTIDNAGNESETLHFKLDILTLTAEAKPTENDGKGLVRLDWTSKSDHTYQVYQKKEGSNDFQSISITDLTLTPQIKVLNLYPTTEAWTHIPMDEGFTTWDGEQVPSLHRSAQLKRWMEAPNSEHPKGYGMGYIEVTPASFNEYNTNPISVLKNSDGSWKYDVIYYGHWDGIRSQISNEAIDLLGEFIDSGRGFLAGHDTLGYNLGTEEGLNRIRDRFNVKIGYWEASQIGNRPTDFNLSLAVVGDQIKVKKEGLLTAFPWKIGKIGSVLSVPITHTTSNFAYGDVWLDFHNHSSWGESQWDSSFEPFINHYLTTWNNTAMIQTGHSNGAATPDEQKVIANTIFYLNQLTVVNYLNDLTGTDSKAPEIPSINSYSYTSDQFISLQFDAVQDYGTTYEYFVKAMHKNGTGTAISNTASATVTTGVKGYSWIADNNADTIPDDIIEQSNNSNIKIPTNNRGPYYLHIKAIDQAGNVSETLHYELTDIDAPTLTLTQNPTDWTNQDVIITVTATDNGKFPSGIKEIILPDGNRVAGSTATFTAIQNGTYTFEAVDFMGNRQTASITISNIDKIKPTGSIIIDQNQDEFYEEDTEIHINMSDILDGQERLSGIAKVEIFDVNGTYSHTMTNPTDYQQTLPWVLVPYELSDGSLKAQIGMILTDKAGNTTTVYSKEVTIIKVRVEEFHLTDVVNPSVYNKNNPFTRLTYPNIPSQELLSGGSFEFEAVYSYPPTANTSWTADYEAIIHYIRPDGGRSTETIELTLQPVDGIFTARHSIPFSISTGTEVYLELSVKAYNGTRKLMGQDSFPDPQGTLLKIGEVTGDIRSLIQFNEIY